MLYIRMIFVLCVSLYTSRVLLRTLGVVDYGLYNIVGGIVMMLGFFNGAIVSSTQRFFSYAIGQRDTKNLNSIFSTIVIIQIALAILILLVAESLGLWFVHTQLNIPPDRFEAALWVYHCAIVSFILSILSVPYSALIITHEDMDTYAYISISDILLKLFIIFLLPHLAFDKLKSYALLLVVVSITITAVYIVFCRIKYPYIRFIRPRNKELFSTLLSYMGWNLWGNLAAVIMNQGVNILLNLFFGPAVNAARAISYQVNSAINQLTVNFQMAMNPQIVKSYAQGDLGYMHTLVITGAKISFFMILTLSLPIIVGTDVILGLWLGEVPKHAVLFTQLVLVLASIDSISGPLMTAAQATGKIKKYQTVVGILLILNLPVSYVALLLGAIPEVTALVSITISIIALFARLYIICPLIGLKIRLFLSKAVAPVLKIGISVSLLALGTVYYFGITYKYSVLIVSVGSVLAMVLTFYFFGLSETEKGVISREIKRLIKK